MQKDFDYFTEIRVNASLSVDDIGNCAILAYNDQGYQYTLIVATTLGETQVLEFGPVHVDLEQSPESCICVYRRFEYNERQLIKTINTFLNDSRRQITQAMEVDIDHALATIRDMKSFLRR